MLSSKTEICFQKKTGLGAKTKPLKYAYKKRFSEMFVTYQHAHVYTFSLEQCDQVNFLLLNTLTSSNLLTQRNFAESYFGWECQLPLPRLNVYSLKGRTFSQKS